LALASVAAPVTAAPHVDVRRRGRTFDVHTEADLDADAREVWSALTDYEHLPGFVPGITASNVITRSGNAKHERLVLDQRGEFRFLFFRRKIALRLDVQHRAYERIDARALPLPAPVDPSVGEVESFEGRYELLPPAASGNGIRLVYRARFVLAFDLPPLVGTWAVRDTIAAQFNAMLEEIARRHERRDGQ
jgi:hypothetical protein